MRQPVDKIALQLAMILVCQKCRLKFSNANFSAPNGPKDPGKFGIWRYTETITF